MAQRSGNPIPLLSINPEAVFDLEVDGIDVTAEATVLLTAGDFVRLSIGHLGLQYQGQTVNLKGIEHRSVVNGSGMFDVKFSYPLGIHGREESGQ